MMKKQKEKKVCVILINFTCNNYKQRRIYCNNIVDNNINFLIKKWIFYCSRNRKFVIINANNYHYIIFFSIKILRP